MPYCVDVAAAVRRQGGDFFQGNGICSARLEDGVPEALFRRMCCLPPIRALSALLPPVRSPLPAAAKPPMSYR
ncbi:MAG: hypothetical protein H6559_17635 [Lewinellaceae bacterium]|nr:hypothetical protein [Lewinellaceae bacterium]